MDKTLYKSAAAEAVNTFSGAVEQAELSSISEAHILKLEAENRALQERVKQLQTRNDVLHDILMAIPDHLTVHDRHDQIIFTNWEAEDAYWERKGGERDGTICFGCYFRGEKHCETCQVEEVFQTGMQKVIELYNPESREYRSILVFPVASKHDQDADVSMVAEYVRNVTATRRMERELREAKEAAEMVDKAKSEFLATMSHEIRTPMNGVLGMLDLAMDTELDEEQREYLEAVQNSAESLLALINDVLDFSKIEAGMVELDSQAFRLRKRLSALHTMFVYRAEEQGLDFRFTVAEDVPDTLVGDPLRLRQILVNLLDNALKFTEYGHLTLNVTVDRQEDEELFISFAVEDTGTGILPAHRERIFDSFAQADGSFSRRHQGTGLGLAICKRLSELMGGSITLESTPGKGACFTFTVPFSVSALPVTAVNGNKATEAVTYRGRILVAEDHPVNLMYIEKFLKKKGFDVTVVTDGTEVVPAMQNARYDIVLMDIAMPKMDGLEATAAVRACKESLTPCTVPVIAMTAHAMKGDREQFLAAGMDDYIGKPINSDNLLNLILKHIDAPQTVAG